MSNLPRGWTNTTLGEVGEYLNGRGFKKSEWRDSGRPIIRIQNLTGTSEHFNHFAGPPDERYLARSGDILVSWAATLGVFVWKGPEAVVNQHIFKVRTHIDRRFHRYLLLSVLDDLRRQTHGSGMVHITKSRFENTAVILPPLVEQERIVAAIEEQLSRLDTGVAVLGRIQKQLKRMRRAVLQTAFVHHLADAPIVSLSEAATTQLGRMLSASRETGEQSKPYLRNRDVQWGHVRTQDLPTMDFAGADAERFRLNYGDVLICEGGEIGRAAVWTAPIAECYFQKAVHRVRCSTALNPYFLRYLLEHYAKTRAFDRFASGSTIAHLPQEDLRRLPVPIPSVTEQQATVSVIELQLSALDHLSGCTLSLMDRTSTLRSSILAAAVAGELVPQKSCEEPASVLLERIAAQRASSDVHKSTQASGRSRRKVTI